MNTHCLFNKNTPLPTRLYTHLGGGYVSICGDWCTPFTS